MRIFNHRLACVTVCAAALAGCNGFALRDANQQLTAAYTAKVTASAREPRDETGLLLAMTTLDTLAKDAGSAAAQQNGANQVALYRIAAVAAWQAGDSPATDSFAIAGQGACAAMPSPPQRDCAMLAIIPELRSIDEQTEALEVLARQPAGSRPTPEDIQALTRIADNYTGSFSKLMDKRGTWANASMPHGMLSAVDANLGVLVCNQMDKKLMRQFRRTPDRQLIDAQQASINAMQCRMAGEGVSLTKAPCAICR